MSESAADAIAALRDAIERFAQAAPPASPPSIPTGRQQIAAGSARDELRWTEIDRQLAGQIAGRRVLVVGPATDYDAAAFAARGAQQVLACASPDALGQAQPGTFDIVHCNDLLHRVLEPVALLRSLRRLTGDDGMLLIGSMMIADPERSEYLRFIPDRYAGDPTWWFLPGQLAFRWLVQTAGFEVEAAFGEREGPRDTFPIVAGYLRATPR